VTRKIRSLRSLFLRRMLWVLLPSLLIGGSLSWFYAASSIMESYDLNLLDAANDLVHQVQVQAGGHLQLNLPPAAHQMLAANNDDDVLYAVWDSDARLLAGFDGLQQAMANEQLVDRYSIKNLTLKGQNFRTILLKASLGSQVFNVSVAQTTRGIDHLLRNVLVDFLGFGSLLIVVACFGVVLGVKRSLIPIEALRTAIARRAPHDLRPLPESDAPGELQPIIRGVNELLGNLEKSLSDHRRFVANAAHQMRTPLAILRSKLEVALNKPASEMPNLLGELLSTTERASHLVKQLLALAHVENADVLAPAFEPVDMPVLLRKVAADFVEPAEKQQMELEFELADCTLKGNALLLQELVSNLLDNAINYAGFGAIIKVRLHKHADSIELSVTDNGAGVPAEFLSKLGQPFFRYQPKNPLGCGLGLAIAKEIVALHKGSLSFATRAGSGGFSATILLPMT